MFSLRDRRASARILPTTTTTTTTSILMPSLISSRPGVCMCVCLLRASFQHLPAAGRIYSSTRYGRSTDATGGGSSERGGVPRSRQLSGKKECEESQAHGLSRKLIITSALLSSRVLRPIDMDDDGDGDDDDDDGDGNDDDDGNDGGYCDGGDNDGYIR